MINNRPAGVGTPVLIIGMIAALIVGALLGYFIPNLIMQRGVKEVPVTLAENQLDTEVGSYVYKDETYKVTAREAIVASASLESMKQPDGTYQAPSSEMILAVARDNVLTQIAEERGITLSDEDIASYASTTLGTSDYAEIGTYFGIDEAAAKEVVRKAAVYDKLRTEVVEGAMPMQPMQPAQPAEGQENTPTAEYATYITDLLGENWDKANNTWANQENPYYESMKGLTFSNDSATFSDAQIAFYVAYSNYTVEASAYNQKWYDYINELYKDASISIYSLTTVSAPVSGQSGF